MGLFGLAGINTVNRTKEIGIRKVLGAEPESIFILLNKQYVWLSSLAFTLAVPLAWYLINRWLESFKFLIKIGWEIFTVSILTILMNFPDYFNVAALWVDFYTNSKSFTTPITLH